MHLLGQRRLASLLGRLAHRARLRRVGLLERLGPLVELAERILGLLGGLGLLLGERLERLLLLGRELVHRLPKGLGPGLGGLLGKLALALEQRLDPPAGDPRVLPLVQQLGEPGQLRAHALLGLLRGRRVGGQRAQRTGRLVGRVGRPAQHLARLRDQVLQRIIIEAIPPDPLGKRLGPLAELGHAIRDVTLVARDCGVGRRATRRLSNVRLALVDRDRRLAQASELALDLLDETRRVDDPQHAWRRHGRLAVRLRVPRGRGEHDLIARHERELGKVELRPRLARQGELARVGPLDPPERLGLARLARWRTG